MNEYLKIRIQKKCAETIEKELGCLTKKVGKEHYALYDLEAAAGWRWCLRW